MSWAFNSHWTIANDYTTSDTRHARIMRNNTGTNYLRTAAFDYFSDTAIAGEYINIALVRRYWGVKFYVGTAFAATSVEFIWEYRNSASTWATLRVTNPNAFLSTGEQIVTFTPPSDWYCKREEGYHIRCRIVSVSGLTDGGANSTQVVQWDTKCLAATGTETTLSAAYTADLAGTYTTLPATTSATGLVPLEMPTKELKTIAKVDVVLSGTTAGASDTVDITGEDELGNVITESIDVSAGNGTYTSSKAYCDITQVSCTGFSDGTITVNQKRWGVIIRDTYDGTNYTLKAHLSSGDGTTSGTLTLKGLNITFCPGCNFICRTGTLTFGQLINSGTVYESSYNGCSLSETDGNSDGLGIAAHIRRLWDANTAIYFYGSRYQWVGSGYSGPLFGPHTEPLSSSLNIYDSVFSQVTGSSSYFILCNSSQPTVVKRSRIIGEFHPASATAVTLDNVVFDVVSIEQATGSFTFDGCQTRLAKVWNYSGMNPYGHIYFKDMDIATSSIVPGWNGIPSFNDKLLIVKRFNLKVVDASGDAISGATVTIKNVEGTSVFSGTTDAGGEIAEQTLVYYSGSFVQYQSSFTWVIKTPHTVTISKPGYQTKTLKLTMDRKREEVEVLEKEVPIYIGKGKVLVNIDPKNSQNNILA